MGFEIDPTSKDALTVIDKNGRVVFNITLDGEVLVHGKSRFTDKSLADALRIFVDILNDKDSADWWKDGKKSDENR